MEGRELGRVGEWQGLVGEETGGVLFVGGRSGVVLVRARDWWTREIIRGNSSDIEGLKRSFGGAQHRWRAEAIFGEKESVIVEWGAFRTAWYIQRIRCRRVVRLEWDSGSMEGEVLRSKGGRQRSV